MSVYKQITFPKDYNQSFEEFKKAFSGNWVFLTVPAEKKESELKKAYAIATKHLTDGQLQSTGKKSKETDGK